MSGRQGTRNRIAVDFIACDGYGICADVLPENFRLDDWGYPIVTDEMIDPGLMRKAKRAVRGCPVLALRIEEAKAKRH
jgi:ferredoxin